MKKIVAIMAISLMLFTSCGQIKKLVGVNENSEGSENIESKIPTSAAKKTFWDKWGTGICVGGTSTVVVLASILGWKKCYKTVQAG
jgi:hypothetical protein